jgi:hypothetical protein
VQALRAAADNPVPEPERGHEKQPILLILSAASCFARLDSHGSVCRAVSLRSAPAFLLKKPHRPENGKKNRPISRQNTPAY